MIKHSLTNTQHFLTDHPDVSCLLDAPRQAYDSIVPIEDWSQTIWEQRIPVGGEGFYSLYFVNCDPEPTREGLYFQLDLIMRNGKNYLSAGDQMLPSLFYSFSVLYVVLLGLWVGAYLVRGRDQVRVLSIHYLMALSVFLKLASVFFHAVELHYLNSNGHPGGWTWIYLLFSLLKGTSFFVVIALIGTGWAFIKPYLNERDRNVFLAVIPLQIISNIALIIVEETTPGTRSWFAWISFLSFLFLFPSSSALSLRGSP